MSATLDQTKCKSLPLVFYLEELPGGSANANIPLLIRDSATHRAQLDTIR
ncbi:hypothetical protein A2U01_0086557, partial [Trifolium medium]|nr:hypothetical protein [Trifolium medium]